MKKLILMITIASGMCSVMAQSEYYWYKGKKVKLTKNETKKFVVYNEATNQRQANNIFARIDAEVKAEGKHGLSATVIGHKGSKGLNGKWAVI
jgi:hypothetical protein